VGRHDEPRLEPRQDPLPVGGREAAPGDTREEDVDALLANRVVDQVRAPLVVEAHACDPDRDPPDLAASVGGGRERVEVLAGQVAVEGDGEAQQQFRVHAGSEADLKRAELVGPVGLNVHRLVSEPVQRHQVDQRVRAVGAAAEASCNLRRVDDVVEWV
jgi:hypothetical protein